MKSSGRYWLKILMVDSDDYGDPEWKYYSELYKGKELVWTDYHREMPTLKQVLEEVAV